MGFSSRQWRIAFARVSGYGYRLLASLPHLNLSIEQGVEAIRYIGSSTFDIEGHSRPVSRWLWL
jgi:hypothetical protein